MRRTIRNITIGFTALLVIGCGQNKTEEQIAEIQKQLTIEGDTTIYGLACDGCNDTIIVYLQSPYMGSDPDTLNILEATRSHHIFGHPRIGDKVAIMRNDSDATVADIVIVIEDLQAEWCYKVRPSLRQRAGMDETNLLTLPDSLRKRLFMEREYGIHLKSDGTALPIGMMRRGGTSDEESPVVYPELRRYFEWHIFNGQLVLQTSRTDSTGVKSFMVSDTADIVMITPDTLVLRFSDHEQAYYKRMVAEEPQN